MRWRTRSAGRVANVVAVAAGLTLALAALGFALYYLYQGRDPSLSARTIGLSLNKPGAFQGYTLIAPVLSNKTYLIDMQGKIVRTWESDSTPSLGAYLLENGHLMRTGAFPGEPETHGSVAGGLVREYAWEGELTWAFEFAKFSVGKQRPHHDITRLPNGNVLMIVWDGKTAEQAVARGRRPHSLDDSGFLIDSLIEIKPTGAAGGAVVWEWHLWDHLIQDQDLWKPNYGNVAEHPELVDVNAGDNVIGWLSVRKDGLEKLRSIGYVGNSRLPKVARVNPDWSHLNGVAYNPELDQVMVTSLSFSEFWIIDHSTSTAEAAGHTGGRSGKGGDILYRWGNPRAYRAGTEADQRLFAPHHAHWIPRGLPGEGHVLVFNNGPTRPDERYSSVEELILPVDGQGRYSRQFESTFRPDQPCWSYSAPVKSELYSMLLSSAQRLPNGNTLICSGNDGMLLEVTSEKKLVWKYVVPPERGVVPGVPGSANTKTGGRSESAPGKSSGTGDLGLLSANSVFRAYRYGADHPALKGRDLTPGSVLE